MQYNTEIEGVGLILCATVDYKGQRIIGQSIIPGIFAQVLHAAASHNVGNTKR